MATGVPTALAGKIVHAIEGQPCIEATRFEMSFGPPLAQRFGFAGLIGTTKGQAGTEVKLTFAGVAGKQQFNLIALAAENASGSLGFDYDFWDGELGISNHWLVPNCFLGGYNMTNDPQQGAVDKSCTIMGGVPVQIQ
jgi:hypothetical protein